MLFVFEYLISDGKNIDPTDLVQQNALFILPLISVHFLDRVNHFTSLSNVISSILPVQHFQMQKAFAFQQAPATSYFKLLLNPPQSIFQVSSVTSKNTEQTKPIQKTNQIKVLNKQESIFRFTKLKKSNV